MTLGITNAKDVAQHENHIYSKHYQARKIHHYNFGFSSCDDVYFIQRTRSTVFSHVDGKLLSAKQHTTLRVAKLAWHGAFCTVWDADDNRCSHVFIFCFWQDNYAASSWNFLLCCIICFHSTDDKDHIWNDSMEKNYVRISCCNTAVCTNSCVLDSVWRIKNEKMAIRSLENTCLDHWILGRFVPVFYRIANDVIV